MGAESVPHREVVTARPGTDRAARPRPRPAVPPERTAHAPASDAAVFRLMRRQMRAALTVTALLALSLGLLPLTLRLIGPAGPRPDAPLAVWLVLGIAPYPALLAAGVWYVRRAERNEGDVTGR
ncbi:hypothetical protein [Streptomyces collinus]|uniref:hypothetical protein n=1 Tax=Streptomyces collinus TaxID=42684 RepID=UPI0005B7DE2B|nr:hypothetical protein [Streptomyces collinus]UJA11736.1 hypothetical protein HGI10_57170 [Streptomyces collinus]UJA13398.1 hypothetical protein HGI09_06930 [Streptomyces collinus]